MKRAVLFGMTLALVGGMAVAQTPPAQALGPNRKPARGPSLAEAQGLVQEAMAVCKAKGHAIGVSVVDTEGLAKVTLVADGSWARAFITVRKANAALTYKMTGAQLEEKMKADPVFAAEVKAKADVQPTTGSAPLLAGGEVIGGIGISGADHEADQACADAAVAKYAGKLK